MCDSAALLLIIKLQATLLKMDQEMIATADWSREAEKRRLMTEIEEKIKNCESATEPLTGYYVLEPMPPTRTRLLMCTMHGCEELK